ncbi:MAG: DNA polymerase/3'-5' exonuclease PolX [Methanobacteriaceae archaeon]|nr:DNA polymerase/3'-5' exonuclease PolX [Methanobacteriaceae archaeon]
MENKEVAKILYKVADFLEMEDNPFRPKAYRRAAHTIEFLSDNIDDVRKKGQLEDLPGIGKNIAQKIEEILDTGYLGYLEDLKLSVPVDFDALSSVEGLGPKKIKLLYKELGITNLDDLEIMAKRHKIRRLKGMGEKSEKKILENIEFARKHGSRKLLGYVLPLAQSLKEKLERMEITEKVEVAGSIRRRKETIGDIDILVITSHPRQVMDFFTNMKVVKEVINKGPSKSTVRLKEGVECDLRVFEKEMFGAALMYFTGSKEINVELRRIALQNNMKLNEYGLFKGKKRVAGVNESEIFHKLGMDYIEPELRENRGEIKAAIEGKLPILVDYNEIRGDLQMHSNWSDGSNSIIDMAHTASKMGYEYIALTDHAGSLRIAQGLDEKRLKDQMKEIDKINETLDGITILKGVEVNIDSEGKLDIKNELLNDLDIVVASIHSGFRQEEEKITYRIIKAMENENVNIIGHPTGRKIQERKSYNLDLEKIFQTSMDNKVFLEINSQPNRLDLKDVNIKKAIERGCKMVINTDAHSPKQLKNIDLGIATARRGWASSKDIINTLSLQKLEKILN